MNNIRNSKFYRVIRTIFFKYWLRTPKRISSYCYRRVLGEKLNWDNPQTLNEKINWLKFNSDTSDWTRLADKYQVRQYLVEKGFESLLVPLYAKWDTADDIDFSVLPREFVLKTNHGSGEILIVKDKCKVDEDEVRNIMNEYLCERYGQLQGEPHYLGIKPCIIAEKLLIEKENVFSTSLVDYKVWVFSGKPYFIWTCYNRTKESTYVGTYDLNWDYHPEHSIFTDHYRDGGNVVPRPKTLDKMLKVASELGFGFPEVRVDFYEVDGNLFFGEMTFTGAGGFMPFFTKEFQLELGNQVILSNAKRS